MLLHFETRVNRRQNDLSSSFRLGYVLLEGEVSAKFFQVSKEKSEKWLKIRLHQSTENVEKRTLDS